MIDKNGDGLADHLYFGDMGGQVFRVDLDNTNAAPNLVKRVALLAQLGNAETTGKVNDRRFYEMPAVDYTLDENNKLYAAVAIGSGDRNFPASDKSTDERFYVIRDYDAARFDILNASMSAAGAWSGVPSLNLATYSAPFNHLSLADVSSTFGTTATTAAQAKKGWYIEMPSSGEKVLSSASIFSRPTSTGFEYQVNFNSFAPDSSSSVGCSPVSGATNTWSVLLKNGTTSRQGIDLNASTMDDRFTEGVAAGITGSGVPMIIDTNGDGQGDTLIELTGTGAQARGAIPPGLGKIQRTRWYDKRAN
jgi:type IV pilus assembly protein PilY1